MSLLRIVATVFVTYSLTLVGAFPAETNNEERIKTLEDKVEYLSEELRNSKLEEATDEYKQYSGLSPAASKVYYNNPGLSIGGYGEIKYRNYSLTGESVTQPNLADIHRIIVYTGYKYSDSIVLNTEVEFEHGGFIRQDNQPNKPGVFVEFANIDFLFTDTFNLRAGLMLVPLGLVNQLHEPIVYRGGERPATETTIIPSTWREVGVMAHGKVLSNFDYKTGVVNGQNISGIRADTWLSGTKQAGSLAKAEDLAFFSRFDYTVNQGSTIGVSAYYGGAGQDILPEKATLFIADAHMDLQWQGLQFKGLFVFGTLSDIEDVNSLIGQVTGSPTSIGSQVMGYYAELGYDVWPLFAKSNRSLIPFFRFEQYDLQAEVAGGETASDSGNVTVLTGGVDFKPIYQVVIKTDYRHQVSAASRAKANQSVNITLGFIF